MRNYENGKIYQLVLGNKIYIGSTITKLSKRLDTHRQHYKARKNGKKSYCTAFELFQEGYDQVKILLIEEHPCENREQLLRKEGEIIKATNCVNQIIAGRSDKEWREENAETIKTKKADYYQKNKEYLDEKKQVWSTNNIEKVRSYKSKYRQKMKGIKKKCECGCLIDPNHMAEHRRSKKHESLMK